MVRTAFTISLFANVFGEAYVSEDGINWQPVLTLEDSPISQYSYPSIIQGKDGKLHAIYTWRRQRIKYAEIDPTKF